MFFGAKLSGHVVQSEQKQVSVKGIKGHMDCKIDGEVIDIKTASGYAFKKFKDGTLAQHDSFGYLSQLAGYETCREKQTMEALLSIKKQESLLFLFLKTLTNQI